MTHQSNQTNGASLEDCHTNFFALTDLCGIKWRKFVNSERPNASSDPLDDPILRSYSRCMQADILCVWRRIQSTKQDISDLNALGEEVNNTKVHPPLSLAAAKELWIFWYGEEPDLTELVDAELLRVAANQMTWNGTWERGLTYECRSLLFKALHNLMERFVLTKDIVRFGKWFVQPCTSNERIFTRSSQHLSFSFTFFVHGDTVCASIDLREHPAVRPLTKEHLSEAAAAFAAAASSTNNSQEQTSPNSALVNEIATGGGGGGENSVPSPASNVPKKPRKVILAPFGMAATLTGNSYKADDPMAEKILEDWASFFPLCNKENTDVPPVVEVISGGHKMFHPSIYVLVTDLDDMEEMEAINASQKGHLGITSCSNEVTPLMALPSCASANVDDNLTSAAKKSLMEIVSSSSSIVNSKLCNAIDSHTATYTTITKPTHTVERLKIGQHKYQPCCDSLTSTYTCNTINTHAPPQAATEMPERAWQDCVTNSLLMHNTTQTSTAGLPSTTTASSSGQDGSSLAIGGNCGDDDDEQMDIKPNPSTLMQKQNLWHFVDPTQKAPCICTKSLTSQYHHQVAATPGHGTPLHVQSSGGGASSYSRNSLVEIMPVPSVGSPGTPAPSPYPNSTLSQPSSVPPVEQLLGMSPRGNTSISNSQQSPNLLEHMLDKNTPAPTPTDQHDNKSITTSPYLHPTSSVEPTATAAVEGGHANLGSSSLSDTTNTTFCSGGGVEGDTLTQSTNIGRCTPIKQQQKQQQQPPPPHPQSQKQQQPQQPQQIIGTITVKKFDLQPTLLPAALASNLSFATNITRSTMDMKLEPAEGQLSQIVSPTSNIVASVKVNAATVLPNNLKRNATLGTSSSTNTVNAIHEFLSLYKPPKICVKDMDNFVNDDCLKLDVLYDFAIQDAWSYHNIKRFKHNDLSKPCRIMRTKNLYESHTHIKPLMPSPRSVYGSQLLAMHHAHGSSTLANPNFSSTNANVLSGELINIGLSNVSAVDEYGVKSEHFPGSTGPSGSSSTSNNFFEELDIKTEIMSGGVVSGGGTFTTSPSKDSKSGTGGNLFTVEGLNPSPKDLEQLFETSSNDECGSMQIHTPPDSNNPSNGCPGNSTNIEELKRNTHTGTIVNAGTVPVVNNMTATATAVMVAALQNCNNSTGIATASSIVSSVSSSLSSSTVSNMPGGANTIQAEDLTKMFPTPPSHEQHHPNSSPCQMDVHMTDLSVTTTLTPLLESGLGMLKIKQEYSVELGSPVEEPIEDWSYVYRPPQQTKFVGSSKYAPLTNLPSQSMPPFMATTNSIYKPSWQQQKSRNAHQQQQQQQQQKQQHHLQHSHSLQQQHHQQQQSHQQQHLHHQLHELLSSAPRTPLHQPRTPLGPMSSSPMHNTVPTPLSSGGGGGSSLLLNQLNCPQAALTNATSSMQQFMHRAGMSPISPASYVPFPHTSPMLQPQPQRHTPIHPPPPYEVAVASPALSTSSSTAAYINKQYHSQEPPQTPQSVPNLHSIGGPPSVSGAGHHTFCSSSLGIYSGGNGGGGGNGGMHSTPAAAAITREFPEVSSLIVNILLYDTALNVFRDHNFDSSTVCVCNADSQRIGNIRGADSGVYVPLPGTTFNPLPTASVPTTAGNIRTLGAFGAVSGGGCGSGSVSGGNGGGVGIRNALDSPASLAGAGSSSSTTPSTTAPASNGQQHITGYVDDDSVECTCGFSSVINRRLAYRAGLFYEDELEITGFADDPKCTKEQSLVSLLSSISVKSSGGENNNGAGSGGCMGLSDKAGDQLAYSIFDLLLDQCSIIQTSSSAIHRTLQRHRRRLAKKRHQPRSVVAIANVLEYRDATDIISLALEQARLAFDGTRMDVMDQHMVAAFSSHGKNGSGGYQAILSLTSRSNVHKWPYIPVGFTRSNKDIVTTMKSIQPMLQNAFHSKSRSAAGTKDATYTVSGPLTWRQFHRLAGRASGQCEPQPIPSIIVGHDKDWISVAPLAIHYWDKFLLEPYSYARDVVYLAIAPNNDYVISKTKTYLKELSSTYEMCKLGRHTAMCGWGGILTVDQRMPHEKSFTTNLDNWLCTLEDSALAEKLRMYAHAFQYVLLPYLQRIPNNKCLLNSSDGTHNNLNANTSRPNGGGGNNNTNSPTTIGAEGSERGCGDQQQPQPQQQQHPSSNTIEHTDPVQPMMTSEDRGNLNGTKTADIKPDVKPSLILSDPLGVAETLEEINPAAIVLYVVEPFSYGTDSADIERLACIAILRMYAELLKGIPDMVKANINIQIISLESVLELGRTRNRRRFSDEIKCLALNIFSQCRRHMVHAQTVKSLTGFGTAANMETFLKNKDEQNRRPYRMYTPPYVLAPIHEKNDKTDFSRMSAGGIRTSLNDQKYSVMYCNYCMSEDQSWLLATVTDDRGEMLEKACINIDVPNRSRRRKAPARRIGLSKLMDYIMGLISQTTQTWRLVIGRVGRIGHSELKSWSALLSKQNLQKATKQLKDMCKQCQLMYPPSILSACLVTLEPDSKLRVMPDQFTPDERFSQISIQNPLSTPQDVTCTHILVFPTSAVCLSFTRQFQNEPQVDLDNDFLNFEEDEEPFNDTDLDDLLIWENRGISDHNSPDRLEDNRSWQSAGGNNFNSGQQQDLEEVGSINQQPLAVGYLVSTAPTGRMPTWFWAACPHLEDVCPVFLKTALHLHVPNIQTTDDILNSTNAHSSATDHPLDSTLTADVLRYVLEGYNALSWLALDSNTHDRLSCLPINVQTLMDLYFLTAAIA